MEKIKDPINLLTIINSFGLVGIFLYFYKQNEAIKSDMQKMHDTLKNVSNLVKELKLGQSTTQEEIKAIDEKILSMQSELDNLLSNDNLEATTLDIEELAKILGETTNKEIELPSSKYKRQSRYYNPPSRNVRNNDRAKYTRQNVSRNSSKYDEQHEDIAELANYGRLSRPAY